MCQYICYHTRHAHAQSAVKLNSHFLGETCLDTCFLILKDGWCNIFTELKCPSQWHPGDQWPELTFSSSTK